LKTYRIDFMGRRRAASTLSVCLVVLSLLALVFRGLNLGIDFTGGALFEAELPAPVQPDMVRATLAGNGLADAIVQRGDSERQLMIRVPTQGRLDVGALSEQLTELLERVQRGARIVSSEVVGPAIGAELRDTAGLAAIAAFGAVGVYIMLRFAGKFAIGAMVALIHDVIVTVGAFAMLGLTFDMSAFAAVLAIIGYSINDTIVVYDRIRENLRGMRTASPEEVINRSLNQTLERTLVMSATTLFTVLALLFFGGNALRSFSAGLTVGVIVGTYSSIYIASSLLLTLAVSRTSLIPPPGPEDPEHP
jgi:preprotein translocase subunit SecF